MKKKMDHLKNFLLDPSDPFLKSRPPYPGGGSVYLEESCSHREVPLYTCPMHPSVEKPSPGDCPICGVALEAQNILENIENSQLKETTQRFWIACIFSLPLFILAMSLHIAPSRWASSTASQWIELILATPVVIWCGQSLFKRAWDSLQKNSLNMFTLIGIGIGVSYLYSVFITLFHYRLEIWLGTKISLSLYFESAAVITTCVLLGQILELKARTKLNRALQNLLGPAQKTACIICDDGNQKDIPLRQVVEGDILRVQPGEKIPVDGIVIEGESLVDESILNRETIPLLKLVGSSVISGTLNGTGAFLMRAEHVGKNTLLARIAQIAEKAQNTRAPIQNLVDLISSYFVPLVILIAWLSATIWGIWGPDPKLEYVLLVSVSTLIITCPCSIGLATPMSHIAVIGRGVLEGILIKNMEGFESFEKVDTLVIDKTGTLTLGTPTLLSVASITKSLSRRHILSFATALEKESEHPIAKAILESADREGVSPACVQDFKLLPGIGITGRYENKEICLGGTEMMRLLKIDLSSLQKKIQHEQNKGHTSIFLAVDGRLVGFLLLKDPLKKNTSKIIKDLQNEGLNIIMLTGDSRITAQTIAHSAGITTIHAEASPFQKQELILNLQKKRKKVAMVGHGIKDAPALSQANVGIAMGVTDIATESTDLVIMSGNLEELLKARRLSQLTFRNIRQNLFLAFVYNTVSIPIAAGLLYPNFGILLNPKIASIAMFLSLVSVILNASRLSELPLEKSSSMKRKFFSI